MRPSLREEAALRAAGGVAPSQAASWTEGGGKPMNPAGFYSPNQNPNMVMHASMMSGNPVPVQGVSPMPMGGSMYAQNPYPPQTPYAHPLVTNSMVMTTTPPPTAVPATAAPSDTKQETPKSLAKSARKDWKRHGAALTQSLEDRRRAQEAMPGTLTVGLVSADTRRDVAGAKFTAYIMNVHLADGGLVQVEHRYSEFAKLQVLLQQHSIQLPCVFPEKHWAGRLGTWTPSLKLAPKKYNNLIQYRKVQLDEWLVHLVEKYNLGEYPHRVHQAVHEFLTQSDKPPCDQENIYAAPSGNPSSKNSANNKWNNPFSFTLGSAIRQSTITVQHMFGGRSNLHGSDQSIPLDLLQHAKGLCFLTVLKAGLVVSGRVGSGLFLARLNNPPTPQTPGSPAPAPPQPPQWSAPCALGTVGMGWGVLAGGDITHYLVILTTDEAIESLLSGTVQLGAELGVAVGPVGRGATSQVVAGGTWTVHPAYSYAHSQGLFMGMSLEGSVLKIRKDVNAKFYGHHASAQEILSQAAPPKAAEPLYAALQQAATLPIPEDAFRPSQLFQDASPQRPMDTPGLPTAPIPSHVVGPS